MHNRSNCPDYYNDSDPTNPKCNSLTHKCEDCPDRVVFNPASPKSNVDDTPHEFVIGSTYPIGVIDRLDNLLMVPFEFTTLTEANINRQKEWDPSDAIGHSYRGNEMAGELGEALEKATILLLTASKILNLCNMIKKVDREHLGLRGSRVELSEVAKEFGDAQICLSLAAIKLGINLEQATKDKFNESSIKLGLKTRYI